MADLLGQRSLFGFGVVLAWLVLFHLLVNIWLLCIFTSLLVVLGSWLGSHAILESNNVVHLERFITMEQVLPSAEDELHLDQEIHNTVKKIIRDFVTSWYSTVSSESGFEVEVQQAMISMAMELKKRAGHVDRKELTQKILNLLGGHLQDYHRAKELTTEKQSNESNLLWKEYSGITVPHLATASETVEVNYVRAVVDLLLHVLVASPHLETRTGRFVVGELITCNVLLPLFSKLSDPDWLNLLIIDIFDKSGAQRETTATEPPAPVPPPISAESATAPPQQTADAAQAGDDAPPQRAQKEAARDPELSLPELAPYDALDSEEADFPLAEEYESARPFLRQYIRGSKSNPFYQENDSDLDSPLTDNKPSSTDSLVMMGQEESAFDGQRECAENSNGVDLEDVSLGPVDSSCPKVLVNSEIVEHPNGLPSVRTAEGTGSVSSLDMAGRSPTVNQDRELLLGVEQTVMGNPNGLGVISPLQGGSQMPTFSFEPLSSPEGPVIIQNLRITGTITAKEHRGTGSHPYTLYTIKYETSVGCENPGISEDAELLQAACESASLLQSVAYHMVNRRYSEFLNLQTRLEEKNELRKLIKGVKGPKKMFPDMPFGNMDSDKIEARKGLLETFLKQLCAIPEIANSEEMQEFLALNTDARIAFVKKPFIVSRIDKIVVNAIVDTLKTAFPRSEPQSPTEDNEAEVDGGKLCTDKKKSRLKLSGKNIPLVNGTDTRPAVLFKLDQTGTVFNGMSLGDLQAFISEQENVSGKAMAVREGSPVSKPCGAALDHSMFKKQSQEHGAAGEMALTEVALNILCLLMKDQWSWLCSENVQRTIRLLFGTLINRWLEVSVANLTCTSYWVVYLQVIQDAVWPGGALPVTPQPERSQQQKDATKKQALDCLMRVLPDLVSDMLGSEKYKLTWQSALDSFQDSSINRHLVYCLLDLLLDFLVPEIPEEDFQRSLLQAHCKNPEKMLA